MIHFTCDGCDRRIDTDREPRYILRLEVYEASDSTQDAGGFDDGQVTDDGQITDAERDHLAELEELLERADDYSGQDDSEEDEYRQARYDLCGECRKRMLSNPLARLAMSKIDFSDN